MFVVGNGAFVVHNCGLDGNAKNMGIQGNPANKVPGQKNLYYGQAADTDVLSQNGWRQTRTVPPSVLNGDDFPEFIRSQYPNEFVSDWKYNIETWTSPDGLDEIENHYWSNPYRHPGEYYHHH